jgi:hypothetical protein
MTLLGVSAEAIQLTQQKRAHAPLVKVGVTFSDASDRHVTNGLTHLARREETPRPSQSTLGFKLCGPGLGQCVCKHASTLARANLT